jgi:hypothetical protein
LIHAKLRGAVPWQYSPKSRIIKGLQQPIAQQPTTTRGANLRRSLADLFENACDDRDAKRYGKVIARRVLRHPLLSGSVFSRFGIRMDELPYVPPDAASKLRWAGSGIPFQPWLLGALSGFFTRASAHWDINYNLDDAHSEYLSRHNAWKDFESGIVFSRVSIVCNCVPVNQTVAAIEPLTKDPNTAEIMDLFTHEQYFWPFYAHYIPDHGQRLDTAIRWVTEHGYKPVFFHEGFLGAPT